MNITTLLEPPFEPVTLQEVYAHLRLDAEIGSPQTHEHDALLTSYIKTARIEAENYTRRTFIQKRLRLSTNTFGTGVSLWHGPVQRVESVEYYDGSNVLQTLAASEYFVTDDVLPAIMFPSTFATPTLMDRPDAVRVTYVAGYAASGSPATTQSEYAANVPEEVKNAILFGVQKLYEAMAPADKDALERTWESMLFPLKITLIV